MLLIELIELIDSDYLQSDLNVFFRTVALRVYSDVIMDGTKSIKKESSALAYTLLAFNVLMRLYLTLFMIISDCDETFNYWEPLNLLVRGFGKETWEYSPVYAIRSYAYLIPYYIVSLPVTLLGQLVNLPPYVYFYWIRLIALNGFNVFAEWKLFASVSTSLGPQCANWFIFLSSIAPGMSHGAVALLPSSLALACVSLATSYVLLYITTPQLLSALYAVAFFLYGGIYGWPFALALAIPFGFFILASSIQNPGNILSFAIRALTIVGAMTALIVVIDSTFYKKLLLVPLNIVTYNVFGGEGEGPEIFGVEPFIYYVHNLLLNFNATLLLACAGCFLSFGLRSKQRIKVLVTCTFPLAIWLSVFASQEHKEERFLYPIYPLIVLSASVFLSWFLSTSTSMIKSLTSSDKLTILYKRFFVATFAAVIALVSILRIMNLVENYSAPLTVFSQVAQLPPQTTITNVCVGREWYHFPASFFLPDNYRLRFVKSGFDGLLPGDFKESSSILESTSNIPDDMNNKNIFSAEKVISFEQCDYYVDNNGPIDEELGEPSIILHRAHPEAAGGWDIIRCEKIIDPAGKSSGIGRLLWVPATIRKWVPYNVDYMNLCLAQKRSR